MPLIGQVSGSHTHLTDGTSHLIAGSNVTITTGTNASVTISSTSGGSVAGSNTQVQFNNSGDFGADADFFFVAAGNMLNVPTVAAGGIIPASAFNAVAITSGSQQLSVGSDTMFFVSGNYAGTHRSVIGGNAVISGSLAVGSSEVGLPAATALSVYGNVDGSFVATIDNDQSSNGHVLKLSTDGNGSGSRLMEMEDGDGDTVFRARADGRFGFGPSGVSSMGAGTFVVGIDGDHAADIAISKRLQHLGDSNTFMDFPAADQINFQAGGVELLSMLESSDEGQVLILSGGAPGAPNPTTANDVNFFVSGSIGHRNSTAKGISVFGGDVLSSGSLHVLGPATNFESSVSNSPLINIKNTTNDTNAARLRFTKDKGAAGADGDDIGSIEFVGDDANQDQVTFVQIMAEVSEADNGSEGGKLSFGVASHDGEMITAMALEDGAGEDEVLTTINAPAIAVETVTADGATLDPAKGFHSIMNGTGGTVATTLADATTVGKLVVITNISSGGATTVAYGAPDGSTVTKTLSNGSQGLLLISVSTGSSIKWIKLGDVS